MNHVIKAALKLSPRIIWDYFSFMNRYAKHPEKAPLEKRYAKVRSLISKACDKLNADIIVIGKENIPNQCSCYFGNHLSAGETLAYFKIFDKPTAFVGKKEVEKMPFVGKMFASGDGLFLDRENLKQELRVMMKVQQKLENNICNIVIFPEGTRNKDPLKNIMEFHKGTFRSAIKAGAPIVPVVNYGGFRLLSLKKSYKKIPIFVKILKPLYKEDYEGKTTDEISLIVHDMIQKELSFSIRKLDHEYMSKLNDSKYRFNSIN